MNRVVIARTDKYTYLGATITDDSITNQCKNQIASKLHHVRKFNSFLAKNSDAPFPVKKKVWDSAVNSAIFYSASSWLTKNLKAADKPYMDTVKQLLGVRQTTCSDILYIELNIPNAKTLIIDKQIKFFAKLRTIHQNNYITKVIDLATRIRSPMGCQILTIEALPGLQRTEFMNGVKQTIIASRERRNL